MESVFVKNMPEATVNRTNQKKPKKKKPEGNVSARVSSEFPQVFFFFFWLFLVFLFFLRKPADRLGVVSPCERSEN